MDDMELMDRVASLDDALNGLSEDFDVGALMALYEHRQKSLVKLAERIETMRGAKPDASPEREAIRKAFRESIYDEANKIRTGGAVMGVLMDRVADIAEQLDALEKRAEPVLARVERTGFAR